MCRVIVCLYNFRHHRFSHTDDLIPVQVVTPDEYTDVHNPPYSYYMYYMYANIRSLNNLRASLGLNTYAFRYVRLQAEFCFCALANGLRATQSNDFDSQ
jgi:adenosine deaminase